MMRPQRSRLLDFFGPYEDDDWNPPPNGRSGLVPGQTSPGMTSRFNNFSITNPERQVGVPKQTVNTTSDLEHLMLNGRHASLREGLWIHRKKDDFRLHSAVLFETVNTASGSSSASRIRYLPLVAAPPATTPLIATPPVAPSRRRRYSVPDSFSSLPPVEVRSWPLDVLPDTKRYIQHARARRSQSQISTTNRTPPLASMRGSVSTLLSGAAFSVSRFSWPPGVVPVELFEMITRALTPRDIRNMRLVCKEFDSKSSPTLFKEVVVPFTAELYDMIEDDVSARMSKGKARASDVPSDPCGLNSYETHEDSIYYRKPSDRKRKHGLRVFQEFGHHMSKFGIRFEVTEYDLSVAPAKQSSHKHVDAYHGGYAWPPTGYPRFDRLAKLESSADEIPRMTAALANLVNVREIGLSLDSGLGFLGGPDRSHYDMIFDGHLPLFGEGLTVQHPHTDGATQFWSNLRQSRDSFQPITELDQERLLTCILDDDAGGLPSVLTNEYDDSTLWPTVNADGILGGANLNNPIRGIFYTTLEQYYGDPADAPKRSLPLSPKNMTNQQKQWLLETGWAQSAFLDTYMLALADNPQIFHKVTKITISKISSGLLSKLDHCVFWDALPNVENVTVLVSPDWRTVSKDDAGDAALLSLPPSDTINTFRGVVQRASLLENIKRLRFGYTNGGEYGKGVLGRNNYLMPAPITAMEQLLDEHPDVLSLDHIEDLTLVNCWLTPQMLKYLTTLPTFASATEKILTLDSVSLTANTKYERNDAFQIQLDTVHDFREGSWPAIINDLAQLVQPMVSDPENLDSSPIFDPDPLPAPYNKFTLTSCGYVFLQASSTLFDQSALTAGNLRGQDLTTFFNHRGNKVAPHLLGSRDKFLGMIIPRMTASEMAVLRVWGLQVGWPEGMGEEATYDGFVRGGEGRFSGCIRTV